MIGYLIGIVIFLCVLHLLLNYNERARIFNKIPGPKRDFLIGNGLQIIRSSVDIMKYGRTLAKEFDGIFSIWVYPLATVFIYNPEDIEIIISSMKFSEKSLLYKFFRPWLRDGLLISKGAKWQERRKIMTPAFHFNILRQFFYIIEETSERFVDNLKKTVGKPIDVLPVLSDFTLNSICETAMGTQLDNDTTGAAKSYKKALYDIGSLFVTRFVRIYLYPDFLFELSPWGRKQRKCLRVVHSFTGSVIEQRKEHIDKNGMNIDVLNDNDDDTYVYKKKKKTALLDLLIAAEKEGLIDKTGIQEEVDTFMFEGHDTTASGLTFFLMLMANHKNVQGLISPPNRNTVMQALLFGGMLKEKIQEELTEILGTTKRLIKMEDLNKMKYLECCIKESLRMYPPVHFISRNINETTVLSNYTIPAGTLCHISILDLHYRENIYKDPNKYIPDRFLPENCEGRHPYAYIPFSAGPRNCIGQKFAMMEMKIVAAKVLQEFNLVPVTRHKDITFVADLILRHDGPVLVNFIKREL